MSAKNLIRNFSIIAHIDHGKSTLADRLLEITGTISPREMKEQVLDRMDLERERGITIKAQAVRINFKAADGRNYTLNLIDTPGHVDFTYEVSRSLAACEGALLVVDASQGVEAQTAANAYLALENNLRIIPVINKIDLPSADIERVKREIKDGLGIEEEPLAVSAKTGAGVEDILEAVVTRIPPPGGEAAKPLRALIFDSFYDQYRGVVVLIRVVDGGLKKDMKIKTAAGGLPTAVEEVGILNPDMERVNELTAGQVGYLITGIKNPAEIKVGDTVIEAARPTNPLPGYKEIKPMVYCGLYPVDGGQYQDLRDALNKLILNDSALSFQPETSGALGFGFRCGFLGLLHLEIVEERLEREYRLELIATAPSVAYKVIDKEGRETLIRNPADFPAPGTYERILEPYINAAILTPPDYVGPIMEICQNRRGELGEINYLSEKRVRINYFLPLSEIVLDFYDKLKSQSKGYASLDYEYVGYRESDLVKLDILLSGEPIDAFSSIISRDRAYKKGKSLVTSLRRFIPRQMFEVAVQAAVGGKIIARETIKAKRKDVTSKCYGGDISRKRKLLEKQKAGKKRMKQIGKVSVPQEAFLSVLKVNE